jgi:hypothetical protein
MKTLALTLFIAAVSTVYGLSMGILIQKDESIRLKADRNSLQSEASHLRNLNWLLARQIERQKGGEQLNQMKP